MTDNNIDMINHDMLPGFEVPFYPADWVNRNVKPGMYLRDVWKPNPIDTTENKSQ